MFVQALAEYADTYLADQLSDEAWEEKPVPYWVALDQAGTFLGKIANNVSEVRGKKTVSVPARLSMPRSPVPRNAGLYPLLAADDIKYVLGVGPWTAKNQETNNQERYEAFVALINKAASETGDEGLKAAAAFYGRPGQVEAARVAMAEAKAGSALALALKTEPLVKRRAVKSYWSALYATASSGRVARGGDAECLISGKFGPIAPTHEKIKGLASLGGQSSGVSLMSFDKDAFCSYGWEQNANSPVAPDRAMAYVLALNDLLRPGSKHRRDIAGVGFIFWTKEKTDFDPMAIVEAEPEQIQRLLSLDRQADPDPNMFYMAGLTGNGARLMLRYWISEPLARIKANVREWVDGLRVIDVFSGELSEPPSLWKLRCAIEREGEPPADRVVALVRRAIEGEPLGYPMLSAALGRLRRSPAKVDRERTRGSHRMDPSRVGLIRLCVNDLVSRVDRKEGKGIMSDSLDLSERNPAYLCGRLLAVYESLQWAAHKLVDGAEVNQTVADRYYSLALSSPGRALTRCDELGKKHLRKLRRPKFRGLSISYERKIDEICVALGGAFPMRLSLEEQGRFVLGYHYQRAQRKAQEPAGEADSEEEIQEVV